MPEGGQPNNTNATKWKTPEERIAACEKVCEHLRAGKPKEYFPDADWDTVENYIKNYPVEFPIEQIRVAERDGKNKLIAIGYAGMTGKIKGFNSRTWEFVVQNMTSWKLRSDVTSKDEKIEGPVVYLPEEEKHE